MPTVNRQKPQRRGTGEDVNLLELLSFVDCISDAKAGRAVTFWEGGRASDFWFSRKEQIRELADRYPYFATIPDDIDDLMSNCKEDPLQG